MTISICATAKTPHVFAEITLPEMAWVLAHESQVQLLTQLTRAGHAQAKLRLPMAALGGPFRPLPPHANHGRCVPPHTPTSCPALGYRNAQHLDWDRRTSLVLIDVDNLAHDPRAVLGLFRREGVAVVLGWVSARGGGLKLGVLTDPVATDAADSKDAWRAAYGYVAGILASAGLTEGVDFRIDATHSAAQGAIMAHDPDPLLRVPDPAAAVPWKRGDRLTLPHMAGAHGLQDGATGGDPLELAFSLPWTPGNRATSMLRHGWTAALRGFDLEASYRAAHLLATTSGLVAEDGEAAALRHWWSGWTRAQDATLGVFQPPE